MRRGAQQGGLSHKRAVFQASTQHSANPRPGAPPPCARAAVCLDKLRAARAILRLQHLPVPLRCSTVASQCVNGCWPHAHAVERSPLAPEQSHVRCFPCASSKEVGSSWSSEQPVAAMRFPVAGSVHRGHTSLPLHTARQAELSASFQQPPRCLLGGGVDPQRAHVAPQGGCHLDVQDLRTPVLC